MTERTDVELIVAYFAGEETALEFLISRYMKPVFGFVYARLGTVAESEDVVQETFVKVWRHLKRFDQNKSFKTWVLTIAKNTALDWLKKKKTVPFSDFENVDGENIILETLVDTSPLPDELAANRELAGTLAQEIKQLSPPYRRVISLRHNEQRSFREMAEMLGESLNTVKSRYRRAMLMLREILSASQI